MVSQDTIETEGSLADRNLKEVFLLPVVRGRAWGAAVAQPAVCVSWGGRLLAMYGKRT